MSKESSYVGKQKIVFYKTKLFKPPPAPTIVLIHGFGADKNHWLPVSRFLKNKFNLIILDVPGFGESPLNSFAKYTLDEQVSVIMEFLLRIVPSDQYIIGGNSLGGFFSAVIAAKSATKSYWLVVACSCWSNHGAARRGCGTYFERKKTLCWSKTLSTSRGSRNCVFIILLPKAGFTKFSNKSNEKVFH